jgi:hypothetical protein
VICFTYGERSAYTILFAKLAERGQLGYAVVHEWILSEAKSNKCA